MAAHKGSEGLVTAGGSQIGQLTGYTLDTSAEVIDQTILGSTSKVNVAGTLGFSGSVDLLYDETASPQMTLVEGASIAFVFLPEGNTSGDVNFSGTGIVDSVSYSAAVDGNVTSTASFQGTGALTRGTVS